MNVSMVINDEKKSCRNALRSDMTNFSKKNHEPDRQLQKRQGDVSCPFFLVCCLSLLVFCNECSHRRVHCDLVGIERWRCMLCMFQFRYPYIIFSFSMILTGKSVS